MTTQDFGNMVREYRMINKMTQTDLAMKIFVTKQAISKYELGKSIPDKDIIMKIYEVLGIPETEPALFTPIEKENNDMTFPGFLTQVNTIQEYERICKIVFNDFKLKHPGYSDPILYMTDLMSQSAIGMALNECEDDEYCDYMEVQIRVHEYFSVLNIVKCNVADRYLNDWFFSLADIAGKIATEWPEKDADDEGKRAFYNGIHGIGSKALEAGETLKKIITRTIVDEHGRQKEILKSDAFISEFEAAITQLNVLFSEYNNYETSDDEELYW